MGFQKKFSFASLDFISRYLGTWTTIFVGLFQLNTISRTKKTRREGERIIKKSCQRCTTPIWRRCNFCLKDRARTRSSNVEPLHSTAWLSVWCVAQKNTSQTKWPAIAVAIQYFHLISPRPPHSLFFFATSYVMTGIVRRPTTDKRCSRHPPPQTDQRPVPQHRRKANPELWKRWIALRTIAELPVKPLVIK